MFSSATVVVLLSIASSIVARIEPPLANPAALTVGNFEDITCFNFTDYASPLCNLRDANGELCTDENLMNEELMPPGCFFDIEPSDPVFDNFEYRASDIGVGSRVGIIAGDSDVDPDLAFAEDEFDGEPFPAGQGLLSAYIVGTGKLSRKLDGVIDSRINYDFSVDFCTGNTTTDGTITLAVYVTNETDPFAVGTAGPRPPVGESFELGDGLRRTVSVNDGAGNATCGTLTVRFRHYELFAHVGVNGFTIELSADLASTVFFDNAAVTENVLPTLAEDCTRVFINEIDYFTNNEDSDTATTQTNAVEIAGPVGEDITGIQIFLIDGETGIAYLAGVQQSQEFIPGDDELDLIGQITYTFADGLMNAENNEADAILILNPDNSVLQFLCYGLDEDVPPLTITQAGSVTFPGGISCEQIVSRNGTVLFEGDGMFSNPDDPLFTIMIPITPAPAPTGTPGPTSAPPQERSLQLRGCGECYEDFDWIFDAPTTHGALPNPTPMNGMNFGSSFAGQENTQQVFCSDSDLDGYWPANSTLQPDGAGLFFTAGPATGCCDGNDCQPRYGHINPGAEEICDGFDSNCDGNVNNDEGDFDGDGRIACAGDCDDSEPTVFGEPSIDPPVAGFEDAVVIGNVFYRDINNAFNITLGTQCAVDFPNKIEGTRCSAGDQIIFPALSELAAEELCDEFDNDCNGIDNDPFTPYVVHYKDEDGDYFGDPDSDNNDDLKLLPNCFASPDGSPENRTFPVGFAPNNLDCNDTDASVNPGVEEDTCNGVDNDCDGDVDEDADDFDGDGFPEFNCTTASEGTLAAQPIDCNDTNPDIFPGAPEICDGFDNDCNPSSENRLDEDEDGDNFIECEPLPGTLGNFPSTLNTTGLDCNDTNPNTFPGALDLCRDEEDPFTQTGAGDGQDNDCNGFIDDGEPDADMDGFPVLQCNTSDSAVASNPTDCNDDEPTQFPGNPEICDGLDNDCDGIVPDDELDLDDDQVVECDLDVDAEDFVENGGPDIVGGGDCNDTDATVRPNFPELPEITDDFATCDGIDQDCDGGIDEDGDPDFDDDGFPFRGDCVDSTLAIASQPEDCDDTRDETFPGATEICDGRDNDCDGVIPSNEIDSDGDLFVACDPVDIDDFNGTITGGGDCVEGDNGINPGEFDGCENGCGIGGNPTFIGSTVEETEECGANVNTDDNSRLGVDNDCDGLIDEDSLIDADGDGVVEEVCLSSNAPNALGFDGRGDCDDNDDTRFPGNPEICDGIDNDCDDRLPDDEQDNDPNPVGPPGDGFFPCQGDCDDNDPDVHPGSAEICDNKDNDCDGFIDCKDEDSDTFPDQNCPDSGNTKCHAALDCNDNDPLINPGADEGCDGIDTNCDGSLGPNEQDLDGDGITACNGDCAPNDISVFPGAPDDDCNDVDNDCDGLTDEDAVDADNDGFPFQQCPFASEGTLASRETDCDDNDPNNSPGLSEIDFPGDTGFGDGRDNDCDEVADNGLPRLNGVIDVECLEESSSSSSSSSSSNECERANIIIKLINTGLADAENVAVAGRIQLPGRARFIQRTVGVAGNLVRIDEDGQFLWQVESVPSGQSESITIPLNMRDEDLEAIGVQAKIAAVDTEDGAPLTPVVVFTI